MELDPEILSRLERCWINKRPSGHWIAGLGSHFPASRAREALSARFPGLDDAQLDLALKVLAKACRRNTLSEVSQERANYVRGWQRY